MLLHATELLPRGRIVVCEDYGKPVPVEELLAVKYSDRWSKTMPPAIRTAFCCRGCTTTGHHALGEC
jgi:hypothetical protein